MTDEKRALSGTNEWSMATVNVCCGCSHSCLYCFARSNAQRFKRIEKGLEDWRKMRVIRKDRAKERKQYDGVVMFPSTHDITPEVLQPCAEALINLASAGNAILIVSKPHLSVIDVLTRILKPWLQSIIFRFTIGALDGDIVKHWEPFAPPPVERLACLQMAHSRGYVTSVSMEPMLDVKNIKRDIKLLAPWVNHSIWLGKMNKIRQRVVVHEDDREGLVHCGVSPEEVARIEKWQTDEKIEDLYRHFTWNPVISRGVMGSEADLIRWKESIKKVVGIDLETEAGTDR